MKRQVVPNVICGGQAIPLGNNLFYMRGRKHSNGGIDIGKSLEVEDKEVMQITPKSVKVFSAQPMFNGVSPAKMVLGGLTPNKVFNKQEEFKDRFNLKDDGKKATLGTEEETTDNVRKQTLSDRFKTFTAILTNVMDAVIRNPIQQVAGRTQTNNDVGETYNAVGSKLSRIHVDRNKNDMPTKIGEKKRFGVVARDIKRFNEDDGKYATFEKSDFMDALSGGVNAWEYNNGQTSGHIMIDPEHPDRYIVNLTDAYTFDDSNENDARAAASNPVRGFLGKVGRRDGDKKATKQNFYYSIPVNGNENVNGQNVNDEDYVNGNPSEHNIERMKYYLGQPSDQTKSRRNLPVEFELNRQNAILNAIHNGKPKIKRKRKNKK